MLNQQEFVKAYAEGWWSYELSKTHCSGKDCPFLDIHGIYAARGLRTHGGELCVRTGVDPMRKTRNGFWRIGREVSGLTTALRRTPVECLVWLESDNPDEFLEDRIPRM